jgi:thiol-disulfide isomerase/thioredoxin
VAVCEIAENSMGSFMTRSSVVRVLGGIVAILGVSLSASCAQKENTAAQPGNPPAPAAKAPADKPTPAVSVARDAKPAVQTARPTPAANTSLTSEKAKPAAAKPPAAPTGPAAAPPTPPADDRPPLTFSELEPEWRKFLNDVTTHYHFTDAQRTSAEAIFASGMERATAAKKQFDADRSGAGDQDQATAKLNRALRKLDDEVLGRIDALASAEQIQKATTEGYQSPVALRAPKRPEVGQEAPAFELKDPDGQSVSLASLRGKTVVLHFWASWCGFCKKTMPEIQKVQEAVKDRKDVVVLGVNCAVKPGVPDALEVLKQNSCTYRTLLNGDPVAPLYEVKGYPMLYVIGPDGKILLKESGAQPDQSTRILALLKDPNKKT